MLGDIKTEYVDCTVKSVYTKVCFLLLSQRSTSTLLQDSSNDSMQNKSRIYTLYIIARAPLSTGTFLFPHKSPRAILERFIGSGDAVNAPEWTRWTGATLEFQQPKVTFAALFICMSNWDENRNQVRLLTLLAATRFSLNFT
jgi:hypothetical protein